MDVCYYLRGLFTDWYWEWSGKKNWKKETRFKDLFVKMKMRAYINDRIKGKIIEIYI